MASPDSGGREVDEPEKKRVYSQNQIQRKKKSHTYKQEPTTRKSRTATVQEVGKMQRTPRSGDDNVRGGPGGFHCGSARTTLVELLQANPPLTSQTNAASSLVGLDIDPLFAG